MNIEEQKNQIIEELYKNYPIETEISFNEFNTEEKLQNQLILELKYWDLHQKEIFKLDRIDNIMIYAKHKVYDKLKFENDRTLTKSEIEDFYMPNNSLIKKINDKRELQKVKVDFFKMCHGFAKQLRWNIQAFIKVNGL